MPRVMPAVDAPLPGLRCRENFCSAVVRAGGPGPAYTGTLHSTAAGDLDEERDSLVSAFAGHLMRAHNVFNEGDALDTAINVVCPKVIAIREARAAATTRREERETARAERSAHAAEAEAAVAAEEERIAALRPASHTTEYTYGPVTLVGMSHNSIEQPLLVFASREDAVTALAGVGLIVGEYDTQVDLEDQGITPNDIALRDLLFSPVGTYYDGCGEITAIQVRPFEFGSPLARGFNLD